MREEIGELRREIISELSQYFSDVCTIENASENFDTLSTSRLYLIRNKKELNEDKSVNLNDIQGLIKSIDVLDLNHFNKHFSDLSKLKAQIYKKSNKKVFAGIFVEKLNTIHFKEEFKKYIAEFERKWQALYAKNSYCIVDCVSFSRNYFMKLWTEHNIKPAHYDFYFLADNIDGNLAGYEYFVRNCTNFIYFKNNASLGLAPNHYPQHGKVEANLDQSLIEFKIKLN